MPLPSHYLALHTNRAGQATELMALGDLNAFTELASSKVGLMVCTKAARDVWAAAERELPWVDDWLEVHDDAVPSPANSNWGLASEYQDLLTPELCHILVRVVLDWQAKQYELSEFGHKLRNKVDRLRLLCTLSMMRGSADSLEAVDRELGQLFQWSLDHGL